ncbi:MAG: hypothetical protein Q4B73_08945 [Lachnospiraceae bacterium]|nr:hypothetical protein [Lachnospiraceae bacterium]
MGMLDFLKNNPDDELDDEFDDELDEEFDDELDDLDDLDDEDLDDLDDEEEKPASKGGLLKRFKKSEPEPERYSAPEPDEPDLSMFSTGRHSFSYDYASALKRQSEEAFANLERRTIAALEEIRQIAGQSPDLPESEPLAFDDNDETDDYYVGE